MTSPPSLRFDSHARRALWWLLSLVAGLTVAGEVVASHAQDNGGAATEIAFKQPDAGSTDSPGDDVLESNTQPVETEDAPLDGAPPRSGDSGKCTPEKCAELEKAAASAYKDPFYDNVFSYLDDPCYNDWHLGEQLKQLHPFCCASTLDLGGQYRLRYHVEQNMRGLGLTGQSDDFLLRRLRLYANWKLDDWLRAYGEYLDASSDFEELPPRPIEENPSEILNLFVDLRLMDCGEGQWWGRVGRQELLYGSQRLISPLDWANTRRTFDGAKIFWRGDEWNLDGFWVRPLANDPEGLDSPEGTQEFYGLWSTFKGQPGNTYDLYWLGYHDYDAPYAAASSFKYQTVGGRWYQSEGPWLWEIEGGYQFGKFGDGSHAAGFFTLGGGRQIDRFKKWKPVVWLYYDWASGSDVIGNGFNHLFPLGHKYLGFMDFYARTNIQDLNILYECQPATQWKLLLWWHAFWLQNPNDVPYRINETPFVTTPGGSPYLGQELDILATWNMTDRMAWLFGYSHFFTGDWYRTNPTPPPFRGNADFTYIQFQVNF